MHAQSTTQPKIRTVDVDVSVRIRLSRHALTGLVALIVLVTTGAAVGPMLPPPL